MIGYISKGEEKEKTDLVKAWITDDENPSK